MTPHINIKDGSIYMPAAVADTYFQGIEAVIVLIRDQALHVLPVSQMESGGCFLKRRNAAGDRVAIAPDVFHANDLGALSCEALPARWSAENGALVADLGKFM